MNILTFDTEEWYIEKEWRLARDEQYKIYDHYMNSILDLLDENNLKATFFCVGEIAKHFPYVIRTISNRGHEIGCHSDKHIFLHTQNGEELRNDTLSAIHSLEDVSGKKVVSYRAPAFSIGKRNKWALEVLAECGIERDASIYPAVRDFGGFSDFTSEDPCIVKIGDATIKEFPVSLTNFVGKKIAYSGGGYFRFFPSWFIKNVINHSDYNTIYFHIEDLVYHKYELQSKELYEICYKTTGTLKSRIIRMIKTSIGTKGAFDKMCNLVRSFDFVNLEEADRTINWEEAKTVTL